MHKPELREATATRPLKVAVRSSTPRAPFPFLPGGVLVHYLLEGLIRAHPLFYAPT